MTSLSDAVEQAVDGRARELAAEGAAPRPGTARRVPARGRLRGVGAAIAGAGLLAAGFSWQGADGTVTLDPNPSPSNDGTGTVTVPLDIAAWETQLPGRFEPYCGDSAPAALTSDRGFTLSATATPGTGGEAPTVHVEAAYEGELLDKVAMGTGGALIVRDGVVVGMAHPLNTQGDQMDSILATGELYRYEFAPDDPDSVYISPCRGPGLWHADDVVLAAGDYELIAYHTALRTAEYLALTQAEARGHTLADEGWGLWQPGSIDCIQAIKASIAYGADAPVPLQCETLPVDGAEIDRTEGTVNLQYLAGRGPLDIAVTLASAPFAWHLAEDLTYADLGWSDAVYTPIEDLACGETRNVGPHPEISGWTAAESAGELAQGDGDEVALDIASSSNLQRATISLAPSAKVWVFADTGQGTVVQGTATASFDPGSNLTIDRAVDYARTTLRLEDLEMCPGVEPLENHSDPTVFLWIEADVEIAGDDGTRDAVPVVLVTLGEER